MKRVEDNRDKKTFEVTKGALKEVPIYQTSRGKNWAATVESDPDSPGGISREFWDNAGGTWKYKLPDDLEAGDIVEFAADYYTTGGNKRPQRIYALVADVDGEVVHFSNYFDTIEEAENQDEPADHPDISREAHRLRRKIANWRDNLEARQKSDWDEGRQKLIDQLGDDYRTVLGIARRHER